MGAGCTWPPGCLQILVTEVGDETFIIAAIMAMRHARLVVFVGAMSALITMTVSTSTWWWSSCRLHVSTMISLPGLCML